MTESASTSVPLLPDGWPVRLDRGLRRRDGGRLVFGGSPPRVVRLRPAAVALLAQIGPDGQLVVRSPALASLARLLTDRGLAHPCPTPTTPLPETPTADDVTVVVPVRDRTDGVARLLQALDPALAVVVVDDGSAVPLRAEHLGRPGPLTVLRHDQSRGPAAARNTGLQAVATPLVAFLDSDVVPQAGWLEVLLPHFADPVVGLAAPRIVALGGPGEAVGLAGRLAAYEQVRSSLDLGNEEALVVPHGRVSYVPSAALVARAAALRGDSEAVPAGFDEAMPVAEDVDLVWRVGAAGWRCRYVPASLVAHEHRTTLLPWLTRKAYYGTGAAPLARRHPRAVAPVVLPGWAVLVAGAVLAQRRWSPAVATVAALTATVGLARDLPSERPRLFAAELVGRSLGSTAEQTAGALNRHWWPAALLVAVRSRRLRRALVVAGVGEALLDRYRHPSALGPLGHLVAHRLDDWAYGAGLWWGAARGLTLRPLLPSVSTRRSRGRAALGRTTSTTAERAATTKAVPRPPWNTEGRPAPTSGAVAS